MNTLVIGSQGFIGKHLVKHLKKNQITVMDEIKNIAAADSVVHIQGHDNFSRENMIEDIRYTSEIFKLCSYYPNIKQVILFSTSRIRSLDIGFAVEDYQYNTVSHYGVAQASKELLAQMYKAENIPITIARSVDVFGCDQDRTMLIPSICEKAMNNKQIPAYDTSHQWVHVDHVCKFLSHLVASTYIPPSILHITGTAEIHDFILAHTILNMLGKPSTLIQRKNEHSHRYALVKTDKTDCFDLPEYDINQFINDLETTVHFYKTQYGRTTDENTTSK